MFELFDKHGGFRRLHSFTLAMIVQIDTLRFCRRFLTSDPREAGAKFYDPKGRQYDQMTQAARSGRQNIIEGSERAATSRLLFIRGGRAVVRAWKIPKPVVLVDTREQTPFAGRRS